MNGNWSYGYDTLGRISTGLATNIGEGCQFAYDTLGNRILEAAYQNGSCLSQTFTFTGSGTNHIDGYCYDAAGNLLAAGSCAPQGSKNPYLYNGYGTLLTGNYNFSDYTSYSVDEYDRRVAKFQSGAFVRQYLYGADGNAVTEMDTAGNWLQTNVRAGGRFIAELQPSGPTYLHTDHLGTIRAQSNSSGVSIMTCSNLPFGDSMNCIGNTGPLGYHFTGKERDTESGNDYFGARYYASSMGRFMSPDPSGLYYADPTNPQSLNLYAYAMNNPLIYTDPTGMYCDYSDHSDPASGFDQSQFDYHSDSGECSTNGGQWVDDAFTSGGKDVNGRPDVAVSIASTTDISLPPTIADDSAYLDMWQSGVGPSSINYGPNDGMTKQLAASLPAQKIREQYIKGGCKDPTKPYSSGHGAGAWGIVSLNPALAEVGGFTESTSTSGDTTTFTINNTSGQASWSGATSTGGKGIPGLRSDGTTDNPYGPNGPRHNVDQTFTWTEKGLCK